MPAETQFRIALAVVLLLTMAVTIYHRWRAASSGEKISHREEGYLFASVLRLAGLSLWISTLGYLLWPSSIAWAALSMPLRWCGVAVGVLCAPLMYWTLSSLGRNLTDTIVTRAAATLVTRGPYRYVRHPFYVTTALLLFSATVVSASGLIGALSLLILSLLAARTPKEEQMLISRFGDGYRNYVATTGRYLPRFFR